QRIEILQFQVEEIEAAEIDLKEDEQLQHRRDKLNNAKNIADALNTAYLALDDEEGDFSSLSGIRTAMAELENVAEFDQDYQDLSDKTMDAYYLLEEVSTKLSTAIESIEFNPTELLQIEERILTLNTLRKKYGPELSDVLKTLEKIQLELSDLMGGTE